jgi:hypothetical protein
MAKANPEGSNGASTTRSDAAFKATQAALEQEVHKWKTAYESVVAENEHLRTKGEENTQIQQWRMRLEVCEKERNEALDRLRSLLEPSAETRQRMLAHSSSFEGNAAFGIEDTPSALTSDFLSPGAIYQKYLSLKEEYEVLYLSCICVANNSETLFQTFKRKVAAHEASRQRRVESEKSNAHRHHNSGGSAAGADGEGYTASRMQHTRHLVLQYLSCKDRDVRVHMEDALMALFRVNESERLAVLVRRRAEDSANDSYVSSLTSMFGEALSGLAGGASADNSSSSSSHGLLSQSSTHHNRNGSKS